MNDSHRLGVCPEERSPESSTHHGARAFSLYELLVTLALVSALTMVGVPSLRQMIASQRMVTAINSLISALHTTRSEAIKRGEHAVLCPSQDGRDCSATGGDRTFWHYGYLLYIDKNANYRQDPNETVIRVFDAVPGLRIHTTRSRNSVAYKPNGLAPTSNTTFTFCADHPDVPARTVIISAGGRPRSSTRLPDGRMPDCSSSVAAL